MDGASASTTVGYDVAGVRAQFPALAAAPGERPVVFLDSAATTQKPLATLEALERFYRETYGAIARGVYRLSAEATRAYEDARARVARFVGGRAEELVFVRGTTEAINLVAASWGRTNLAPGDEILVTELEHHSNLVPWQLAAQATGARMVAAPVDGRGDVVLEDLERLLGSGRVRMVALAHLSNAIGTVLPVARIAGLARAAGALVLVDGAQAVPRLPVDVGALGVDFYAFSAHKAYGPNAVGALWGRRELLAAMPPYQGGGGMIRRVEIERSTYEDPPARFEAGTPAGPEAVGFAAALDWLGALGRAEVERHEAGLLELACRRLDAIAGVRRIGDPRERAGVVSFVLDGAHPHDVATVLDAEGVAVRAGHHCAQPILRRFDVAATVRASFGVYNTEDEVEQLGRAVERARALLTR